MKRQYERMQRLATASDTLASAIGVELAARERTRQLVEVNLRKLTEMAQSSFWVGLASHSGLLHKIARQEADLLIANDEIARLRVRLLAVRSREKSCVTQAKRLNGSLERKRDHEESLEVISVSLVTACRKLPMLD
ncbi:hypothetical protein [Aestuariivirga sp.]|uniref:hypothetical protein n=1 Tax=Aestuariivirga sp. TaxID=2650926 RepID=UPI0035930F16